MLWVNEGLKKKKVKLLVTQSCQTLCDPMDCSSPGFFIDGIFQGRILGIFPSSEDLPNPGKTPRSPALQADSLPSEPPGNVGRQGKLWGQGGRVKQHSSLSTGTSAWLWWHIDTGGLTDSTCHLLSSLFQGFQTTDPAGRQRAKVHDKTLCCRSSDSSTTSPLQVRLACQIHCLDPVVFFPSR